MPVRNTDKETKLIIEHAVQLAEKLKIKKILVVCESLSLWKALLPHYANHQFIIALSNKRLSESITVENFLSDFNENYSFELRPVVRPLVLSAIF